MKTRVGILISLVTAFLVCSAAAQTPSGSTPGSTDSGTAKPGGGKGNNPPGTPSWGSERMPTRKNPSSPTAPCPAGTTRQNLGQDCHPLDQDDQKPKSKK